MSDDRRLLDITSVSYGRTINLGNFNSERYDLTAEVEPNICPGAAILALKAIIARRSGSIELFNTYLRELGQLQDLYPVHPGWIAISGDQLIAETREQAGIL